MGLAKYEVFAFEAADFPKRSSAFETFASRTLHEPSSIQETEDLHAHE